VPGRKAILVSLKDLESRHDLCQRYAAVVLPVFDDLLAFDEDDETVRRSFEDDFALGDVSASHDVADGIGCLTGKLWVKVRERRKALSIRVGKIVREDGGAVGAQFDDIKVELGRRIRRFRLMA
jgi:hypothetical protein